MRFKNGWIAIVALVALSGCSVSIIESRPPHRPVEPPVEVPAGNNMAAIDAAKGLSFPNDRAEAFHKIAARAYLNEDEQIYFVDSLLEAGLFPSDTTDVILALARNPGLSGRGSQYLVDKLPEFGLFPSH